MADPEKVVVSYPPRDRVVITENDLEINFCLIKEAALGCYEQVLHCPDLLAKRFPICLNSRPGSSTHGFKFREQHGFEEHLKTW